MLSSGAWDLADQGVRLEQGFAEAVMHAGNVVALDFEHPVAVTLGK